MGQLPVFVVNADTGSVTAVVHYLGKNQTVMNTAVAKLEILLDNSLFVISDCYTLDVAQLLAGL